MKFAYQRGGAPLLSWQRNVPHQSRAADTVALGSLSGGTLSGTSLQGSTLEGSSLLPRPGAPEPIGVTRAAMSGLGANCSCSGTCGCQTGSASAALSDIADSVPGGYVTLGVGAFLAWKFLFKKKRR